jgi:putative addiction module component (TIGR02574 family)
MATTHLSDLLSLPADKRADLAIALWERLSDSGREQALPVSPGLAAELDRRWADHLAHPESGVPWEQVLKKLRA